MIFFCQTFYTINVQTEKNMEKLIDGKSIKRKKNSSKLHGTESTACDNCVKFICFFIHIQCKFKLNQIEIKFGDADESINTRIMYWAVKWFMIDSGYTTMWYTTHYSKHTYTSEKAPVFRQTMRRLLQLVAAVVWLMKTFLNSSSATKLIICWDGGSNVYLTELINFHASIVIKYGMCMCLCVCSHTLCCCCWLCCICDLWNDQI